MWKIKVLPRGTLQEGGIECRGGEQAHECNAASQAALDEGIRAHTGVYVGVTGPNLETRAEYRFLRAIGADVVGMSIVPEVIVAVHAGLEVLGMAVVTDRCLPDALGPANIQEIIATAQAAEPKLCAIVKKVIAGL